ncbi:hypothetical protein [Stutzerimonas nitrititolerans]|uniref:hypothetical protein n=1 Tax=Stutzerimonas nitrititolerans TaxID=2482751 RepID=UPI0028B01177|nr:hypothetical protein [Stutzerimonas nitrititolerans]
MRVPSGWYRRDGNKMRDLDREGEYTFRLDDLHEGCGLTLYPRPTDWATAPADATHCWNDGHGGRWYKFDFEAGTAYLLKWGEWEAVPIEDYRGDMSGMEARPALHVDPAAPGSDRTVERHVLAGEVIAVWEDGLPPAGSVCELRLTSTLGEWSQAHIKFASRNVVVWDWEGEPAVNGLCTAYRHEVEMRPVRTPEQIAADERLHKVRNAATAIARALDTLHESEERAAVSVIEAMIDAGYAKAPGYPELVALAQWIKSKAVLRFSGQPELLDKARAALAAVRGDA